jgi:hypothetical protein
MTTVVIIRNGVFKHCAFFSPTSISSQAWSSFLTYSRTSLDLSTTYLCFGKGQNYVWKGKESTEGKKVVAKGQKVSATMMDPPIDPGRDARSSYGTLPPAPPRSTRITGRAIMLAVAAAAVAAVFVAAASTHATRIEALDRYKCDVRECAARMSSASCSAPLRMLCAPERLLPRTP